jgi:chromosomal replication initiation ATPase DnaA
MTIQDKVDRADALFDEAYAMYADAIRELQEQRQAKMSTISDLKLSLRGRWKNVTLEPKAIDPALLDPILKAAAATYGCSEKEIMSRRKTQNVAEARFAVMRYLALEGYKTVHIAALLNRDRVMVNYAIKKIADFIQSDPSAAKRYNRLTASISASVK